MTVVNLDNAGKACTCARAVRPESVLDEAARIVDGDRNAAYGDPNGNHGCTAAMWTAYLTRRGLLIDGLALDARDVCMLNVLQKASRDAHWRQRDNLTDIAGYVRNAEIVSDVSPR